MKRLFMTLLFGFIAVESIGVDWPLRINSIGKYLEDQSGNPFLIVADAGWELTTQITDTEAIGYLDNRAAKGFSAVEIRVIGRNFQSNAPNDYYNNPPFCQSSSPPCVGVHSPWTYRNEAYWARMDAIITAAKSRGMAVLMFPGYLGYDCGSQGWCADMRSQTDAAMTDYGQWIGNRYKNYGNIIWMTGGDADASKYPNALSRVTAMVNAIRAVDQDSIFSVEPEMNTLGGVDSYMNLVDINGIYTYGSPKSMAQRAYGQTRPFMFQEGYYENEHGTTIVDQLSQAFITYLGGGVVGHVFGSCPLWSFGAATGYCDSHSSPFNSWTNNMNSPGSISQGAIGKLMRSRKWWTLVPDYSNLVVLSTKGNELAYHATARETDGETIMVWCPNTNVVTVDMTKIAGTQAKAWWWNPNDNTSVLIGTYNTTGTRNFTPGSARKLLVLDSAASGLEAPGTTVYFSLSAPENLRIID